MWKETDDFWLTAEVMGNSALQVLLGQEGFKITATYGDDMKKRPCCIIVRANMFNRTARLLRVNVVENTAGVKLNSTMPALRYEEVHGEITKLTRIDGILF